MNAPAAAPTLLAGLGRRDGWTLEQYLARGGYEAARRALNLPRDPAVNSVPALIELVKRSGLRGRGGAGFSTGLKWSFVNFRSPAPRHLAVNADESEPGTCKDRAVLAWNPHLLLEGILIACHACGIEQAYVYIRGEYAREYERFVGACAEAYRAGFLGQGALGSPYTFHVTPHRGAGAYVCGEETGLLSSLEGGRGYPRIKPPFPAAEGAWGRPTVVNNVGTLALLPGVVALGAEEWARHGPPKSPGPMVYCLSGHVKRPGLYESPMTVTMEDAVYGWGGGVLDDLKLKAVIPGGASMPVLRFDAPYRGWDGEERRDDLKLPLDFESLRAAGSMLGSAALIVMHQRTCMVQALYNLLRFYHHESCGQCTPCREGTGWLEKILQRMVQGEGRPEDVERLLSIARRMSGTTICLLSDSCAMPVGSFVLKFREEFEHYCRHGRSMTPEAIRL